MAGSFRRCKTQHRLSHPSTNKGKVQVKKIIITTAAAAVVLTGCSPISTVGSPVRSSDAKATSALDASLPGEKSTSPTLESTSPTLESNPVDPYKSSGTWLVPEEIAPGTYRVSLSSPQRSGYTAVCADYACRPGPEMIGNDIHDGPGVLVVPPGAVAVELSNVELTLMDR